MKKSSYAIIGASLAVAAGAIWVATGLGLFKNPASEKKARIASIVNSIKTYHFGGGLGGIRHGLNEYFKEKGEYPLDLEKDLGGFVEKNLDRFYNKDIILNDYFNVEYTPVEGSDGKYMVGTEQPFRYKRISPTECRVWSYGPDEDNDGGKKEYDSKNGTRSNGDLILHIKDGKDVPLSNLQSQYKNPIGLEGMLAYQRKMQEGKRDNYKA